MSPVLLAKRASLERCIRQVQRYYDERGGTPLEDDQLRQDAIGLNLQRAADLTIDIANHCIKQAKLGLPQDSGQSFELLLREAVIDKQTCARMRGMVGFRNVLVHRYQDLDVDIMIDVVENRLSDMLDFADQVTKYLAN